MAAKGAIRADEIFRERNKSIRGRKRDEIMKRCAKCGVEANWSSADCPICFGQLESLCPSDATACSAFRLTPEDERKIHDEAWKEEMEYRAKGVCSRCGATCEKEAEDKCRPIPVGDTGDYECPGENLWQNAGGMAAGADGQPMPREGKA